MIEEVSVKTHLIITDVHEEYDMNWCGKIWDAKPELVDGLPLFIIISESGRIEINTIDMQRIESCAKRMTNPHGRSAITTDSARIYIKEIDGNEKLLGVMTHNHVKQYQQMYDKVGYR